MLRFAIFVGSCVALLMIETIGNAQVDRSQQGLLSDYFAEVEKMSAGGIVSRELEQRRLNDALSYLQQGKFREAIQGCTRVLERFVNHPKGLAILGMAAKLGKDSTLPIPYYERALQLYPQRALTQAQYGKYLAEIGKVEDGTTRLKRAIEVDPKLDSAYVWLARIYVQNRQPELARQILQRRKEVGVVEAIIPNETLGTTKEENPGAEEKASGTFFDSPSLDSGVFGDQVRKNGIFSEEKNEETDPLQLQEK